MNLDYTIGLHIVGFLCSNNGLPATSVIMAKSFGTSPVVLRRVLSKLNQAGLVETKRGANGGCVLSRPANQINLREVYEAVCINTQLFARHPENDGVVSEVLGDYINGFYEQAETTLLAHLQATTVA
ncbi:MAG: Rrf2 family transcriptional regulator, partial [Pseudomonadota bacterium]